ncbi:MAG: amidohydrolase family protein [Ruminiclostridium sp.]|nr:amidohydrolase family protein [Ruminiclostridium sp.]
MPENSPVDPLDSSKSALMGRIVCMDEKYSVISRGVIYIDRSCIVAIKDATAPVPYGFEKTHVTDTNGTIYPGLIELHNHLSYNALRIWDVPENYTNRDQWAGTKEYSSLITGPMKILGRTPGILPALVRYVESKCLLGGVTTSQGIQLASNMGIRRYYRGIVRNVEQTDDADLPEAATKIADVDARDVNLFYNRLLKQSCCLLHLSEGIDKRARQHFLALKMDSDRWAICKQLAGIHATGLTDKDFETFAQNGGGIVWSPMSNLLLYGDTAKVKSAKANGVRMGIGSDWSPSGSKNLLGELKVAKIFSRYNGGIFSDREIISMATQNAGGILGWEKAIGTLEPDKRADLLVINGNTADPYESLINSNEKDISLIIINGIARYGLPALMVRSVPDKEDITVGGTPRSVYLSQKIQDPALETMSLTNAKYKLSDSLKRLPELAAELEKQTTRASFTGRCINLLAPEEITWTLALDELEDTGVELRHRLTVNGRMTGPAYRAAKTSKPLSSIVKPLKLDPLTMMDDGEYLSSIQTQKNLPAYIKEELKKLY